MEIGEQLQRLGASISAVGMQVLPYSFAMYVPVRWMEFLGRRAHTRFVKATWYLALGSAYLVGGLDTVVIVTYICFIEACDLLFQQLELNRERRAAPRRSGLPAEFAPRGNRGELSQLPRPGGRLWNLMAAVLSLVSGEYLLRDRPNSGTVVLVRSLHSAVAIYLLALAIYSRSQPAATWQPNWHELRNLIGSTLPWLGAIFAATYAAFYSRFSAQWTYLANLYNSIMTAQVQAPIGDANSRAYAAWMAGFIEDAEELHLALKPIYASVILSLLKKPGVRDTYTKHTPGGEPRLARLEARLHEVYRSECARRESR